MTKLTQDQIKQAFLNVNRTYHSPDRNGNPITIGDLLLNVEDERAMHDAWAFHICYFCVKNNAIIIREFTNWNISHVQAKDLVVLGNYKNFPEILKCQQTSIKALETIVGP